MSLIVAKKEDNCIIITSDTRLTYEAGDARMQTHKPSEGIVKTINITKDVNMSFAGEIVWLEKSMRYFDNIPGPYNKTDLIDGFLYLNKKSNFDTEFILSIGDPDPENTKIFEIKDGQVRDVDSAWIGSKRAFSKFQEKFHTYDDSINELLPETGIASIELPKATRDIHLLYMKCFNAMNAVVEEGYITEVGGFVVPCIYVNGWFRYMEHSWCYPIGFNRNVNSPNGPLPLGTADEGSYAVSLSGGSTFNLSIYFPHGKFGLIFSRKYKNMMEPECFFTESCEDFISILESRKIPYKFSTIDFKNQSVRHLSSR